MMGSRSSSNGNGEVWLELERATSLSRVVPINTDNNNNGETTSTGTRILQNPTSSSLALLFQLHKNNNSLKVRDDEEGDGPSPVDDWLPITESRTGNSFTAALHLLSSGLGLQSLLVPLAFVSLGWIWGSVCLWVMFGWQLYTTWILIHLHQPSSTGPRYSRYVVLSVIAFGPKLGKALAIFPTMYLSGGTCVLFIITGGGILDFLSKLLLSNDDHHSLPITGAQWFLIFVCIAISVSLFFPTLNSLTCVSLLGSFSAVLYFSLLWILSTTTNHPSPPALTSSGSSSPAPAGTSVGGILDAIGIIALTFRGHNLILEIQGTMPTSPQRPARNLMRKGVTASYVIVALCIFPLAIGGYWAYRNEMGRTTTTTNGILDAVTSQLLSYKHSKYKWILGTIYTSMLLHLICAFQLYAMPALDNLERVIYVSKNKKACPRWARSTIRLLYGGLTYLIAVAFPFIGSLGPLVGAISLPLTLAYPCFMWIAIEKRKSPSQIAIKWLGFNFGVGCLGIGLSLLLCGVALRNLVYFGLEANFFKPHPHL